MLYKRGVLLLYLDKWVRFGMITTQNVRKHSGLEHMEFFNADY